MFSFNKGSSGDTEAQLRADLVSAKCEIERLQNALRPKPVVAELTSLTNDDGYGRYLTPSELLKTSGLQDVIVNSGELRELLKSHRKLAELLENKTAENKQLKLKINSMTNLVKLESETLRDCIKETERLTEVVKVNDNTPHISGLQKYVNNITHRFLGEHIDEMH